MGENQDVSGSVVAELRNQIAEMHRTLAGMVERSDDIAAVLVALFAQHGDPTHITIERAAQLRGCSVKTIRRLIDAGELTLEVIPGTRESGIPVELIYSRWVPIGVARQALKKMREQAKTPITFRRPTKPPSR
jgi:hypothetical protein